MQQIFLAADPTIVNSHEAAQLLRRSCGNAQKTAYQISYIKF
jgi:hypothetical protein